MKILIVGGGKGHNSGVINKLSALLEAQTAADLVISCNGYNPANPLDTSGYDLILWWPDINNAEEKVYPVKDKGTVLICSKVMRTGTTRIDAVSRIFKMQGNAVVAITQPVRNCTTCIRDDGTLQGCDAYGQICHEGTKFEFYHALPNLKFEFELIDALNNTWRKTSSLPDLVSFIMRLYEWTKSSKRVSLKKNSLAITDKMGLLDGMELEGIQDFLDINKELALKVAEGCGNRFFGNFSTRCTKLFPSTRKGKDYFFFSRRNVDKKYVGITDLVLCDHQYYYDENKPSVDTPVQLELYKAFPSINYMIHGHAYIKGAKKTGFYVPCGDLREVDEIINLVDKNGVTKLNLLNHGFLLMATDLEHMRKHLDECEFSMIGG